MDSPVRRALVILRRHFLLLAGPWLAICGVGFAVAKMVQQISNHWFPLPNPRVLHVAGADPRTAASDIMTTALARLGGLESVEMVESAAKVVALALLVLVVTQLAAHGEDTFSAAMERLRSMPRVGGALLKFFAIVLLLGVGTIVVAVVPVALIVPLQIHLHRTPQFLRWVNWFSSSVARVLFVMCIMPFVLDLIWRLEHPSTPDSEAPQGLLMPTLRYAAVAVGVEVVLVLLAGIVQRQLAATPGAGILVRTLVGLAASLLTSLPTVVCVVAVSLMAMGATETVTATEPA